MDQDFKPPEYLSLQGNPPKIRDHGSSNSSFITKKEMTKKPDSTKMALLLSAIGPEALE